MEAAQAEIDGNIEGTMGRCNTLSAPPTPPAQAEHFESPKFDPTPSSSAKKRKAKATSQEKRKAKATSQEPQEKDKPPSVSNCYVFKSQLQEYCQKAGLITPVYETIKEGPSHEPSFYSTVIVNNVRYDSLPGFFNRKAAEQSAAEVALKELAKSTNMNYWISQPVHDTGLCKNLLQEYAQKMNYAIPLYECHKEGREGRTPMYSCTVEIGGIKYIGASATTKKEAEIKAARTALLAIQTAGPIAEDDTNNSIYSVIPQKKKVSGAITPQETATALKPKRGRFKRQQGKKRRVVSKDNSALGTTHFPVNPDGQGGVGLDLTDAVNVADGFEVDKNGQGEKEVEATNTVGSEGKTNGGSDICTEEKRQESTVTHIVSSQVIDSGPMEATMVACSTTNGNVESAPVPPVGRCMDGESTGVDVN